MGCRSSAVSLRSKFGAGGGILLVAWLFVFWPILFGGRALWYGDIGLYFAPLLHFQRESLLSGQIPLWNPLILGGTPFVGNPQSWPLHPSSLLLWVFSAERTVGLIGALHCLWAMLGMVLFLRRTGAGPWGAALGALAFGLSGALVSKCQFPNMVQAASFLPWLLWAIEGRKVFPVALCVGLGILAAHPQMTWMQALLAIVYTLHRRPSRIEVVRILGGTLLGGLLAMGFLLPVAEVALSSVRPKLSLTEASRFFVPPYLLPTIFLAPNFFGNPYVSPPYVGRGNFWEPCAYAGVLPFALSLGSISLCTQPLGTRLRFRPSSRNASFLGGRGILPLFQRGREAILNVASRPSVTGRGARRGTSTRGDGFKGDGKTFWLTTLILSVWLAVGKMGGLYILAFYVIPGARTFHDPARFLHLASFALATLAARGFDQLKLRDSGKFFLLALAALDLGLFARTLNPTTLLSDYAEARKTLTARVSFEDERAVWKRYVDYRALNPSARAVDFLGSGAPNTPMLALRKTPGGYEPVRLKVRPATPSSGLGWRVGLFLSLLGAAGMAFVWQNRDRDRA
jgi:hypothetical protein